MDLNATTPSAIDAALLSPSSHSPDIFTIVCCSDGFQLQLDYATIQTLLQVCKRARPLLSAKVNRFRRWCQDAGLCHPDGSMRIVLTPSDQIAISPHCDEQVAADRSWLIDQADQGNAAASFFVARILQVDLADRQSVTEPQRYAARQQIFQYLEASAKTNHHGAGCHLAEHYRNDYGFHRDYDKALELYRDLAERGLAQAQVGLGRCFENGEGVDQDYETAIKWYTKAANQGNTDGKLRVEFLRGWFSLVGHGAEQSDADALKCWQEVSTQSSDPVIKPIATHMVGWMHYLGRGTPQDKQKGVKIIRENESDEFPLGEESTFTGYPASSKLPAARKFHQLCQFGSAQDWLCKHLKALCLIQGFGTTQNKDMAVEIFEQLANDGHSDSQYWIGEHYSRSWEACRDQTKAFKWFSASADQGNSYGEFKVAECYYYGTAVASDEDKAVEWYRKSAEQGNRKAQYELGDLYLMGMSIPKDRNAAAEWFLKSAAQNYTPAFSRIESLGL